MEWLLETPCTPCTPCTSDADEDDDDDDDEVTEERGGGAPVGTDVVEGRESTWVESEVYGSMLREAKGSGGEGGCAVSVW